MRGQASTLMDTDQPNSKASSGTACTSLDSDPYTEIGPNPPTSPDTDKNRIPVCEKPLEIPLVPVEEDSEELVATQEPLAYGALLSEVAYQFILLITNQSSIDNSKALSGREVVDLIGTVLGTEDRGLALLVGRALEAQNFFTIVTQDLGLQDSLYATYTLHPTLSTFGTLTEAEDSGVLPSGVVTQLTDCYSPTCSLDSCCYSATCSKRSEALPGEDLTTEDSTGHSGAAKGEQRLWENFVAREVVMSVSERERKRQEIIFELIYTEQDFVSDLELIRELYLLPLTGNDEILEDSTGFTEEVFLNLTEVYEASSTRSCALQELQHKSPVVHGLGACLLENLGTFEPFKAYGANQVYSKRSLARAIKSSPRLEAFLKDQERRPACRKLPIESFLARPTTRLGRYPLLLEAILKYTDAESLDTQHLPVVIEGIKATLSEINVRTGIADNRVRIDDIHSHLVGPSELIDELDLNSEARTLVWEGVLKKKSGVDLVDIFVFLFDTHLLMAKKRKSTRSPEDHEFKLSKKPIQLDLLSLSDQESHPLIKPIASAPIPIVNLDAHKATNFPLTVIHLGRQGGTYTLYCATLAEKQKWQAAIGDQLQKVLARRMVFQTQPLADRSICPVPGIYCSATYASADTVLLGADDGIYVKAAGDLKFSLAFELDRVKRLEVLEDWDLVLALSERTLYAIPLSGVVRRDGDRPVAEKLKGSVDFFNVGTCLGKALICAVKTTALSTTGRLYQPCAASRRTSSMPKALFGARRALEFFKEFYIPSESFGVSFLRSKICVACAKGFEVLDLISLRPQGLLNPEDARLSFVFSRGDTIKPIAFFRIRDGQFFVGYDEFGFFVDRAGQLDMRVPVIHWKGCPKAFALHDPYVLAFDPSFVEVRSLETGELRQVLRTDHTVTLRTGVEAIHLLDQAHLPDAWKLNQLVLNRHHPSNVSLRRRLNDARTSRRRGIVGQRAP